MNPVPGHPNAKLPEAGEPPLGQSCFHFINRLVLDTSLKKKKEMLTLSRQPGGLQPKQDPWLSVPVSRQVWLFMDVRLFRLNGTGRQGGF